MSKSKQNSQSEDVTFEGFKKFKSLKSCKVNRMDAKGKQFVYFDKQKDDSWRALVSFDNSKNMCPSPEGDYKTISMSIIEGKIVLTKFTVIDVDKEFLYFDQLPDMTWCMCTSEKVHKSMF